MPEPEDYTPDDLSVTDSRAHEVLDLSDENRTFIVFLVSKEETVQ